MYKETTMLELLETHPNACAVITEHFLKMMIESFVDQSVPEEFKESMMKEGINKDRLALIIGGAPRCLFDVFDENEIYIEIIRSSGKYFTFSIHGEKAEINCYQSRKDCELDAIKEAFKILEANERAL